MPARIVIYDLALINTAGITLCVWGYAGLSISPEKEYEPGRTSKL